MSALLTRLLLPIGVLGLLAATEMPLGSFAQLGVAGLSLGVLAYVLAKVFPKVITDIMAGHAAANEKVCAKLDELKQQNAEFQKDQISVLREAIAGRGK